MPAPSDSRASVTRLHPEHLFDKLGEGRLSSIERRQLESHAAACEACRFELFVRDDLAVESMKHARTLDVSHLFGFGSDG